MTQLRKDTHRLVESFRRIVQEFPVMIYGLDPGYRIMIWNEQCERTTGYFRGEILPDPEALRKLYPDVSGVTGILNRLTAASEYTEYEAGPSTHVFKNKNRRTIS